MDTKDLIIDTINSNTLTGNNLLQMLPAIASHLHPEKQKKTILQLYIEVLKGGTQELDDQFMNEMFEIQYKKLKEQQAQRNELRKVQRTKKYAEYDYYGKQIQELKKKGENLQKNYNTLMDEMMELYHEHYHKKNYNTVMDEMMKLQQIKNKHRAYKDLLKRMDQKLEKEWCSNETEPSKIAPTDSGFFM